MKRKSKGFTILEILISIVILTVGILGILAIFPKAIESASKSIEDTYSGIIAQSV
ncbi:MAG: prepilin-type N-terminal cleavage/methylation domain-containing protein, partial [Planctomycetota bacterium]